MDASLKAKWVADLRSGEILQARKVLSDGVGYCCLAVLGLAAGLTIEDGGMAFHESTGGDFTSDYPQLEALGVDAVHQFDLMNLNDTERRPFFEIADWIEQNIPSSSEQAHEQQ